MIDERAIADHFPHRPRGYFDHAAVSTVPVEVESAVAGVARALGRGTRGSSDWHELTDDVSVLLADELGVAATAVSVLANTGTAINSVARAIPFVGGDEVIVLADDFPSPRMPWHTIPGLSVQEVATTAHADRTTALIAAISPGTRAVSVTHVHATTGDVLDLARLHDACVSADALLIVDGAQAAGLFPGAARHADVYVAASYKWLLAGFGAAVVATGERFDDRAVPGLIGYMNEPPSPRLAVGHSNLFGMAALQAAARVRQGIGLEAIRAHTLSLTRRIADGAADLGLPPAAAEPASGIVSLTVADAPTLTDRLKDRGITTTVRDGALRVSPYLTTTHDDVDLLLSALTELAPAHHPHGGHS
ncbi:aminotransferase class V-fold PLP-dependent enzyme [Microbacterium oxydans]|uniref:aminotransferase class V-fold PLP-dependent enzyme n=1 Tax=Microbacterium sp. B19(2022) TaxID=2914045 RepID=UPI00143203BA|nr:aminotransferase class V-fold PLP-dependent enzyme [Microbacterium sp. B19(2022)]NJI60392.1 aminotransferase class V-fold PLP-dependent enzyme [Microbacterium sp. B19(2022)]